MILNYLKIAIRNLRKHRFYSFINVAGLTIGFACSVMIILYVMNERSFDDFHENGDQIYRLTVDGKFGENTLHFPTQPAPMAPALEAELPEVVNAVRLRGRGTFMVTRPEMTDSFKESNLLFCDPGFFEMFSFPLLKGEPVKVLERPYTVVISEGTASRYFGDEDPIDKVIILDGDEEYTVSGVFADMPENSHLQFDLLMSMSSLEESKNNMWASNNFFTYVQLREDAELEETIEKARELLLRNMAPQIEQFTGEPFEKFASTGSYITTVWQPLDEVYLTSDFVFDIGPTGNNTYVDLFTGIAIFIIILACINFMNLATARSTTRAKEVGVRKVMGSPRGDLIRQFLIESILISLVALVLGLALVNLMLPIFNDLAGKYLEIPWSPSLFILVILSALVVGALAGIYPALFLSSFRPVNILKGKIAITGNGGIRNGLVIFQFFISILLITGTIAINRQLRFIQEKKIGYDKEQVLLIQDTYMLGDQRDSFKKEIEQLTSVKSASYSGYIPVNGYNRSDNTYWKEGLMPSEDNLVMMQRWIVDEDYISTLGMKLVQGRMLDQEIASDSSAMVLNETAFRRYGFSEGKDNYILTFADAPDAGSSDPATYVRYKIIGVVEDFHFESMRENIMPLALALGRSTSTLAIKLSTNEIQNNIVQIEERWDAMANGLPFNYSFLDEAFGTMYRSETRLANILTLFAALAIFIGCLGLFGLASFMAERRTKEIGIRKVLGASVNSIVLMLSKHFSLLLLAAFLLAIPLSWWGINRWLATYTYRIDLSIDIFLIAGLIAFLIAGITVAYQSIRAAIANPVTSLRND